MNVLTVQSSVAYGRVGNRAATFALERLGHEPWPIDTVTFSNHPAHGGFAGTVRSAGVLRKLLDGLSDRGLLSRVEAVLSGYLGHPDNSAVVAETVDRIRRDKPDLPYCCDPVMGDAGQLYVHAGIPATIREFLLPRATIATPNLFELATLTGRTPEALDNAEAILAAAEALRREGPAIVIATGLPLDTGKIGALAVGKDGAWLALAPRLEAPAHGAGDAFAALFFGNYLLGRDVPEALSRAVGAIHAIMAKTAERGADELQIVAAQDSIATPPPVAARRIR